MKNVAVLTEDGAFFLFFGPHSRRFDSPHPQGFAIQGKKIANVRGSAQGGAGRRWELTDAQHLNVLSVDLNHCIKP